jgi:hypothetical protein
MCDGHEEDCNSGPGRAVRRYVRQQRWRKGALGAGHGVGDDGGRGLGSGVDTVGVRQWLGLGPGEQALRLLPRC